MIFFNNKKSWKLIRSDSTFWQIAEKCQNIKTRLSLVKVKGGWKIYGKYNEFIGYLAFKGQSSDIVMKSHV